MPNLWLIGMMGSGKTVVGRRIAGAVGAGYADTDRVIETRVGRSIPDLWDEDGETAFRRLESEVVETLAAEDGMVVATGGGVVLDDRNVAAMRRSGTVVWLAAPARVLARRIGNGSGRPLLSGVAALQRLESILEERSGAYRKAAHHIIDTTDLSVEAVTEAVTRLWHDS